MKSRHDRVQASVLAVVMVLSAAGWTAAQQVNSPNPNLPLPPFVFGSGVTGRIPVWTTINTIGNSSITQNNNGDQTINGSLNVTRSVFLPNTTGPNTGVISFGGVPAVHIF